MNDSAKQIAGSLLQIKAIKLNPTNHFTWASGWYSPIYCDNRKILSLPRRAQTGIRGIRRADRRKIPAGRGTGRRRDRSDRPRALVAEKMGKPFIYVRSAPKSHGLTNQVEGEVKPGAKVVVIEDLVSTGGSSLSAVEALQKAGCEVLGMVAIFTYGFPAAEKNFAEAGVRLDTLSNYNTMIEMAIEQGYVHADELETLKEWRRDPASWKK